MISISSPLPTTSRSIIATTVACLLALGIAGCGADKKKESGQTLVKVNGEEITILQLNEELSRTQQQTSPTGQAAASKQVLDALVDRQLLEHEAMVNKVDRDPKVMQAIERAKAQILAQAYLQSRIAKIGKPAKTEIDDYFQKHPEYFSQRKLFDMHQLVVATKDFSDPMRAMIDNAKSLDEVAAWLDVNKVKYARGEMTRSTADLPPPMVSKLQSMQKGQLFVIKENDRTLLVGLNDVKSSPVSAEDATPQIEQYLRNQKSQDAAKAELARLRATARIEYTNKADADKSKAVPEATPTAAVPAAAAVTADSGAATTPPVADPVPAPSAAVPAAATVVPSASVARGVAGLK